MIAKLLYNKFKADDRPHQTHQPARHRRQCPTLGPTKHRTKERRTVPPSRNSPETPVRSLIAFKHSKIWIYQSSEENHPMSKLLLIVFGVNSTNPLLPSLITPIPPRNDAERPPHRDWKQYLSAVSSFTQGAA